MATGHDKNITECFLDHQPKEIKKPNGFGQRHKLILILFLGITLCYAYGVNISVAMVAMIDNTVNPNFLSVNWDESKRGLIFGSWSIGYLISCFIAGNIVQRFGGKQTLLITVAASSILTIITPFIVTFGWQYLFIKQMIHGSVNAFTLPASFAILSKWVHPSERAILGPTIVAAMVMGTAVMIGISGAIAASVVGWPGIFYIPGSFGILWTLFWSTLGANSPADNKAITIEEKSFIESMPDSNQNRSKIPWLNIFRSTPVWTVAFCQFGQFFIYVLVITSVPTYLSGIFNLDITTNALFSALPHIVMLIMTIVFSSVSKFILNRGVSLLTTRKLFSTIGLSGPAAAMFMLQFSSSNAALAISLFTIAVGLNAASNAGFMINNLDLSPNFAGSLMALIGAVATLGSITSPIMVGFVVTDIHNAELWRIVFNVVVVVLLLVNVLYIFFGEVAVQPWNELEDENKNTVQRDFEENKNHIHEYSKDSQQGS